MVSSGRSDTLLCPRLITGTWAGSPSVPTGARFSAVRSSVGEGGELAGRLSTVFGCLSAELPSSSIVAYAPGTPLSPEGHMET